MIKAKKLSIDYFPNNPGEYNIVYFEGKENLLIVLPCGDRFMTQNRWGIQNIADEAKITVTPSILCHHHDKLRPDWHGFLTNGEFISV